MVREEEALISLSPEKQEIGHRDYAAVAAAVVYATPS